MRLWLDYRLAGKRTYYHLGVFDDAKANVKVVTPDSHYIRARWQDRGVFSAAKETLVQRKQTVNDRDAMADMTDVATTVTFKDGVITAKPQPPKGQDATEYKAEVRLGNSGDDETESTLVGTVETGQDIVVNALPVTEQTVHTRTIRKADDEASTWSTVTIPTPAIPPDHVEVEDFAGTDVEATGTIDTLHGYTPMENGAGVVQTVALPPAWNTTNTDSAWGMTGAPPAWSMGTYAPFARYETAVFDAGGVHEFLPVFYPDFSAFVAENPSAWGMTAPVADRHGEDRDRDADFRPGCIDYRTRDRDTCAWNTTNVDRGPLEVDKEVSISQDGTPPTLWETLVEGHRYRARQVKYRFTLRARFGRKQIKLVKFRLSRWIRNKKFEFRVAAGWDGGGLQTYTFSPVPEMIIGTPVATVTVEDTSVVANQTYLQPTVESISKTAVTFRVYQVDVSTDAHTVPTITDQQLHIVLTGY